MRKSRLKFIPICLAMALVLASCGSSADTESETRETEEAEETTAEETKAEEAAAEETEAEEAEETAAEETEAEEAMETEETSSESSSAGEEATYAADSCGADWNEQAVLKAEEYLDMMSFSRDSLISQLEYEGFTSTEAEYAVGQVGY